MKNETIEGVNETIKNVVKSASKEICDLFNKAVNDISYGYDNALSVLSHIDNAIDRAKNMSLSPNRILALRLAALLHNADDKKYFKKSNNNM